MEFLKLDYIPRIGDYDIWSIEWGYKYVSGSEEEEKATLNDWVKSRFANNRLRFLHADGLDPRAQTESLGDNNMKAGEYGIKNLKWIVPKLPGWVNEKGENYEVLTEIYNEVVGQYSRYLGHVATNIGGIYTDYKTSDQDGSVYTVVPKTTQKEALGFIQKNLFETPTWLLDKNILNKITSPTTDRISNLQDNMMNSLLSSARLSRMIAEHNRDNTAYRIEEYFDDIKRGIWSELATKKAIDNYRRNLQKSFVERLGAIVNPPAAPTGGGITISFGPPVADLKKSDIISVAKGTLRSLRAEINAALPAYTDRMSRMHLQDLSERIERILNPR